MNESPAGTKLVLLIEDDPHERRIYGDLLWYNGFDVVDAETAERGYWLAVEGEPDLILLDLTLPDMDGLALCRRLKAEAATVSIPVLVLSARPANPYAALAVRAGCAVYLEKPRRPIEVVEAVMGVIGSPPPGGRSSGRRRTA